MGMFEFLRLLSSKDGDELLANTSEMLNHLGISVYNDDGSYKDIYTLLCEIAKVWNKGK